MKMKRKKIHIATKKGEARKYRRVVGSADGPSARRHRGKCPGGELSPPPSAGGHDVDLGREERDGSGGYCDYHVHFFILLIWDGLPIILYFC